MKFLVIKFYFWIKNLFDFRSPKFNFIDFADCVFENKAYLLIQWKFENAFHLSIKNLKYHSFNSCSSAYILLPKDIDEVLIRISSSWRAQTMLLKLKKSLLPFELEGKVLTNFKSFKKSSFQIVNPKVKNKRVTLLNPNVTIQGLCNHLKISNLNYPL